MGVPDNRQQAVQEKCHDGRWSADPQERDHEDEQGKRRNGLDDPDDAEDQLPETGMARRQDAERHRK